MTDYITPADLAKARQLPARKPGEPSFALALDGNGAWMPVVLPVTGLCAAVFTRSRARRPAMHICNRVAGHDGGHAVAPWCVP